MSSSCVCCSSECVCLFPHEEAKFMLSSMCEIHGSASLLQLISWMCLHSNGFVTIWFVTIWISCLQWSLDPCWSGINFWTYQPSHDSWYQGCCFVLKPKTNYQVCTGYWVPSFFQSFHTSLVMVQNWLHTRLIFGWYEAGKHIYTYTWVLRLVRNWYKVGITSSPYQTSTYLYKLSIALSSYQTARILAWPMLILVLLIWGAGLWNCMTLFAPFLTVFFFLRGVGMLGSTNKWIGWCMDSAQGIIAHAGLCAWPNSGFWCCVFSYFADNSFTCCSFLIKP
jgi:hypothetical protein